VDFRTLLNTMSYITEAKPHFEKAVEHLQRELSAIRTGRATPALVENLSVDLYGSQQALKSLASISTPDPKTVQIEPWDARAVKAIETAILTSDIGINPNVDGKVIRLIMPMMTDETRQRMVKTVKERLEDTRVSVRKVREEVKKKIEKEEGIGEDDKKREKDLLEKTVKEYTEKIDELGKKKEAEITTV